MDYRLEVGDWVIIDGEDVGEVWSIYPDSNTIDVRLEVKTGGWVDSVRLYHHEITKITKEVADIMRGV